MGPINSAWTVLLPLWIVNFVSLQRVNEKNKIKRRKRWNQNADAESKPTLNDKSRLKNSIIGDDFTYSFQHKKPQEGVN